MSRRIEPNRAILLARTQQNEEIPYWAEPIADAWSTISGILFSGQGMALIGILLVLGAMRVFSGGQTQGLAAGKWAGRTERLNAWKRTKKKLRGEDVDDVALWCGGSVKQGFFGKLLTFVTGDLPTTVVPDANRSTIVSGKPGSGKTFSAIDPMLKSAIEQGLPIVLYDYKADEQGAGGQTDFAATLAARHGYKLNIFAPGRDYTCTINPLDFMESPSDDITAKTLAEVFQKNMKGDNSGGDAFFGAAGQQLIQALLQFAKSTRYPDIPMAFATVRLQQLPERLIHAEKEGNLPVSVKIAFSQLMSTTGAEKTVSGIVSTAQDILTRFISPRILPAITKDTNISIQISGKEIIVFQSDIFRQEVVNPLLAAIINVVIDRNFSYQRETPLIFSADEFPTIYLPQAPRWVNEHRSKGFCGIFGFQSFPQIRDTYGKEQSAVMLAGTGSHFWFNPGDQNTAKDQSSFLGEEEIIIENKSKTHQRGEGRGSISKSQQTQTKPLITAYEINQFKVGECIYLNPGFSDGDRESIPQHLKRIEIPEEDISLHKECEKMWLNTVRDRLIQREQGRRPNMNFEQQLQARFEEAERLLPLPPDEEDEEQKDDVNVTNVIPDL